MYFAVEDGRLLLKRLIAPRGETGPWLACLGFVLSIHALARNPMTTRDSLIQKGSSITISFARPLAGRLRPTKHALRRRMLLTACAPVTTPGPPAARPLADTTLPSGQAYREPARTPTTC